jgi:hypothetical protein
MCGVVSEEPELGEHDRQHSRNQKLVPRVAQEGEDNPDRDEHRNQSDDLGPVVDVASLEQT